MTVPPVNLKQLEAALETLKERVPEDPNYQVAKQAFEAIGASFRGNFVDDLGVAKQVLQEKILESVNDQIAGLAHASVGVDTALKLDEGRRLLDHFSIGQHFSHSLFKAYARVQWGVDVDTQKPGLEVADPEARVQALYKLLNSLGGLPKKGLSFARGEKLAFQLRDLFFQIAKFFVSLGKRRSVEELPALIKTFQSHIEGLERVYGVIVTEMATHQAIGSGLEEIGLTSVLETAGWYLKELQGLKGKASPEFLKAINQVLPEMTRRLQRLDIPEVAYALGTPLMERADAKTMATIKTGTEALIQLITPYDLTYGALKTDLRGKKASYLVDRFSIGSHFSATLFKSYLESTYGLNFEAKICKRKPLSGRGTVNEPLFEGANVLIDPKSTHEDRLRVLSEFIAWFDGLDGNPVSGKNSAFEIRFFFFQIARTLVELFNRLIRKTPLIECRALIGQLRTVLSQVESDIRESRLPVDLEIVEGFSIQEFMDCLDNLVLDLEETKRENDPNKLLRAINPLLKHLSEGLAHLDIPGFAEAIKTTTTSAPGSSEQL